MRPMRKVLAAIAGLGTALLVAAMGIRPLSAVAANHRASWETYVAWIFIGLIPVGAAAGGLVAGLLSRNGSRGRLAPLLVPPGLYLALFLLIGTLDPLWDTFAFAGSIGALLALAASSGAFTMASKQRASPAEAEPPS